MELAGIMGALGEPITLALGALVISALFGAFALRSRLCLRSAVIDLGQAVSRDGARASPTRNRMLLIFCLPMAAR